MKTKPKYAVVVVTAPDLKVARKLARAALESRLIACANLVPRVESLYWWQGRLETGSEILLLMKTARSKVKKLEALVRAEHPYDTPEFLVLPVLGGSRQYLEWLRESLSE